MEQKRFWYIRGLRDGLPIGMGYLAVSFTLGIAAKNAGVSAAQAGVMSFFNLTSAGEFAALSIIQASGGYLELAVSQLIINLRYCLMSCALSQKLSKETAFFHRFFMAFGVTDEIFGIAVSVPKSLHPFYQYGAMSIAVPGWTIGTILGVISGNLLPLSVVKAMSIALYGMFLAVIIPPAKRNKILAGIILVSMIVSSLVSILPWIKEISSGLKIILLTVAIAAISAILFPIEEKENE